MDLGLLFGCKFVLGPGNEKAIVKLSPYYMEHRVRDKLIHVCFGFSALDNVLQFLEEALSSMALWAYMERGFCPHKLVCMAKELHTFDNKVMFDDLVIKQIHTKFSHCTSRRLVRKGHT